jgi:hypothetical protein
MNNRDDDSLEVLLVWVREQFGARGLAVLEAELARAGTKVEPAIARGVLVDMRRFDGVIPHVGVEFSRRFAKQLEAATKARAARVPQTPLDFAPAPVPVPLNDASTALVMNTRDTFDEATLAEISPEEQARIARAHPMFDHVTRWHALAHNGTRPKLGHLLGALACCRGTLRPHAELFFTAAFAGEKIVEGKESSGAALLFKARLLRAGLVVINGDQPALLEDLCRTLSAWHAHVGDLKVTRLASIRKNGVVPEPCRGPWVNR